MNKNHFEYQYLNLLKDLLENGSKHDDRTGTGTIRLNNKSLSFDLSSGELPLLTTKKVPARLIIEELRWFLAGSTDVKKLQEKNVKIWNGNGSKEECAKFGREEGDLGPIYGHQWRNFGATKRETPLKEDYWSKENQRWVNRSYNDDGKDQIKYVIDTIMNNPNSRRILFSGWNPLEADLVNPPPCHTFYLFQVAEGKLNAKLVLRSSDTFLGLGFNIASLAILVHLIATATNLNAGQIELNIMDSHLYLDHINQAKEQLTRTPYSLPKIKINDNLKGKGLDSLISFSVEDIEILDYKSHPKLAGKMSV